MLGTADRIAIQYNMGEGALLWSDVNPNLYKLKVTLKNTTDGKMLDAHELIIGLRDFKAEGDKFAINGKKTFLRGKHDGLVFPLTGYAPTDVEEWQRILGISKSYGINHYRFHTCCPPEAAFIAADMLGIYMEPELPFWGTITDETYENHNQAEQDYLISEGFAMLRAFGNHPSFVMMSLGNELWGSKDRLNAILREYKAFDTRHLYTQGSNNFQFVPDILEQDDNHLEICELRFPLPTVSAMTKASLSLSIEGSDIWKTYDLWIYPKDQTVDWSGIHLLRELNDEAVALLEKGEDVLLLPNPSAENLPRSIEGMYCTDFWCYPMFRSISESMNKPVPVGTMGLLIDRQHPVFTDFLCEEHSTYPWWSIVSHSRSVILDDLPQDLSPMVRTIDNFERNHRLALLFECRVLNGRLIAGALDFDQLSAAPEGRQLLFSMIRYMKSEAFAPQAQLTPEQLKSIF